MPSSKPNAINYSPVGSDVELAWGGQDRHAYLAVRDQGPGIEPDEADKVFERFYRGQDSGGKPGTGLGLAIVETLARRWGGDARIEPVKPGTRIRITLPREEGQ